MQPCVQIDAARKRLEAVIGDDHQQGLVVDLLHDAADQFVHAGIEFLNHSAVAGREAHCAPPDDRRRDSARTCAARGRSCRRRRRTALLRLLERVEQHALAIVVIGVALREKRIVVQHVFVQGPSVFGQSERCVRSEQLRQIDGVRHRMRDRQIRLARIDIHRRDVNFDFGRQFLEIEAADSVRAETLRRP